MTSAESELLELGVSRSEALGLLPGEIPDRVGPGGLALYAGRGFQRTFHLRVDAPDLVTVARRFQLKPLLRELGASQSFFVLGLTRGFSGLFAGDPGQLERVDVPDLPEGLDDATRYDDREPALQSHAASRPGRGVVASFHGQGDRSDHLSEDAARYLRMVEAAVAPILRDGTPVVLAGSKALTAQYRKLSRHALLEPTLYGNPQTMAASELQARAREVVDAVAGESVASAHADFERLIGTGLASADPGTVIAAAGEGRVRSLMVASDAQAWASDAGDALIGEGERLPGDHDLLDSAATDAWLKGADVFVLPRSALPGEAHIAAVFRY